MSLVVDTHSFIWFLARSSDLSSVARQAIREAISSGQPVYVSSVTIVEVIYLTEKNRLPRQNLIDLKATLHRSDSGFKVALLILRLQNSWKISHAIKYPICQIV